MGKDLIDYEDATNALEELRLEDIQRDGAETLFTFDSERANARLAKLKKYGDLVKPVRCINCRYRREVFKYSKGHDNAFSIVYCIKSKEYLGDLGYCSKGKERKDDRASTW